MTQPNKVYPVDAIKNGARSAIFNISHHPDADDRERCRQVAAEYHAKLEDIGRCGMQVVTNEVLRAYSFDYIKLSAMAPGPYPDVQILVSLRGIFPQDEDVQYISEELGNYFTPSFDDNRITILSPTSITTLTGLTAALLAWGLQEPAIEAEPVIDALPADDTSFALPAGDVAEPVSAEDVVAIAPEPDKGIFAKTLTEANERSAHWTVRHKAVLANGKRFASFPAAPGRQGSEKLQEHYQQISPKIRSIDHMRTAYGILTIGDTDYVDVQFSVFPFINLANELTVIIYPDAEIPDNVSVGDRFDVIKAIAESVVEHYFQPDAQDAKLAETMISYHQLPWTEESLIAAIDSAMAGEAGPIKCMTIADLDDASAEFALIRDEFDSMFAAVSKLKSNATVSAVIDGITLGLKGFQPTQPAAPLTPEELAARDKRDDEVDELVEKAIARANEMEIMFPATAPKSEVSSAFPEMTQRKRVTDTDIQEILAGSISDVLKGGLKTGEAAILAAKAGSKKRLHTSAMPNHNGLDNVAAMRAGLERVRSEQVAIGHALHERYNMDFHGAAYFASAVSSEIISRNSIRIACEFLGELLEAKKILAGDNALSGSTKDRILSNIGTRYIQFDPRLLPIWTAWIKREANQDVSTGNDSLNNVSEAMFNKYTTIDVEGLSVYAIAFRKMIIERGIDYGLLAEISDCLHEDDEEGKFTFDYCLKRWFAKDLSLDIFIEAMDCLRVLKKL